MQQESLLKVDDGATKAHWKQLFRAINDKEQSIVDESKYSE
jgi:hypothetical protein